MPLYSESSDVLRGVQIDQPRAAHVGHQVEFRATAVTQNLSRAGQDSGIVHYIWTFGDEVGTGYLQRLGHG